MSKSNAEMRNKMRLGIITWITEEDFRKAKERNLEFVEIDVNSRDEEFLANLDSIEEYSKKYALPIGAIGRWGTDRILKTGICETELALEKKLIDAASRLNCKVYITGCNYIEELSYYENCGLAISYFEQLIEYAKPLGITIATYNCRWNNFVCDDMAFRIIHGYLKDLAIKYDTSHCIYAGGDYLQETRDWAPRFAHVHIKGALQIQGQRYDDPPAGLDQTDWGSFMAILYAKGYDGNLSIEPHSENWRDELGEKGIDYTIGYMRRLMF